MQIRTVMVADFKGFFPFQEFYCNFLNMWYISNICSQSVQCNFPWPYTANSIVKQLTQLFSHMFTQAYTDYRNVRPTFRPLALNSLILILVHIDEP